MNSDMSDCDNESMNTRHERSSPSPPMMPPSLGQLEETLHTVEDSNNCLNMCMDLENMLNFIDDYYFTSENEKEQYASKLITLLADGVELNNNLTRIEADHKNIFTNRISQRFAIPINYDTPFTPIKGRKTNSKSPTPPPEKMNKKPRTNATETSNNGRPTRIER
ncbi:hypothetical protein TNCT_225501 [Trichonephila clavata]|uniref:Uncharacterized protein n=1 Tax=Trichonephila clavata TaxID=2740835 RepID=A0A8X6IUV1_TRICU|nr:hypothetical protein TNCT_225501 [Trichonephila clavata]